MLLLKNNSSFIRQASPDKGHLTYSELNFYKLLTIIGLQRYCFSSNWQTFSPIFSSPKGRLKKNSNNHQTKITSLDYHLYTSFLHTESGQERRNYVFNVNSI